MNKASAGIGTKTIRKLFWLNIKLAFLHGELSEKIFVEQPPACEKKGHEQKKVQIKEGFIWIRTSFTSFI